MTLVLANNATSTLAASITNASASITVASADAGKFPALVAGQWFPVTLVDAAGNMEIMKATARAGATITVTRAQEGTTAKAFATGTRVDLRLTAGALLSALGELLAKDQNLGDVADKAVALANLGADDAAKLLKGTVPDGRLPNWLFPVATTAAPVGAAGDDWNNYTSPGWQKKLLHGTNANGPGTNQYFYLINLGYAGTVITQLALPYASPSGSIAFRYFYNNAWTAFAQISTDAQLQTSFDARYAAKALGDGALQRAGGTMTGDLTLKGVPTTALMAATKEYVDNGLAEKANLYQGTTNTETSYPIGHTVLCYDGALYAANAAGAVNTNGSIFSTSASGTQLSGTWRARGAAWGDKRLMLMQRVA